MDEKQEIKQTNMSWFIPWLAGFMFTIGFIPNYLSLEIQTIWEMGLRIFVTWMAWPAVLGIHISQLIVQ